MSIATETKPYTYTFTLNGRPINNVHNPGITAGNIAHNYESATENSLNQMIQAAKDSVASAANTAGMTQSVNGAISNMQSQADKMGAAADNVGKQAGIVSDYAGKVSGVADSLTPYAQSLKDYADGVFGQGQTLVAQGNQLLGTWENFAPLVGKYTSALQSLNPNNQVSLAARDVQSSFQNTQGQNTRAMSRMGVDPSSGAYQAQKAQWDQALATALAGAKTRARNQGLQEQITALANGLNLGSNVTQAGAQIGTQGAGLMANAGDLMGNAANVLNSQGGLYNTAGGLANASGQLSGTQADIFQGNAALQQSAAQLALNLGAQTHQQQMQAQQLLQNAYTTGMQYYASQSQGYGQIAGTNNLMNTIGNLL
jgi:hypothetical protein